VVHQGRDVDALAVLLVDHGVLLGTPALDPVEARYEELEFLERAVKEVL